MRHTLELTPRLRTAADLVPAGARLADIGTDHAYLPAALLLEGKIPYAIAADLRHGPSAPGQGDRAGSTAARGKMAFRLCDGLRGRPPGGDRRRGHRRHGGRDHRPDFSRPPPGCGSGTCPWCSSP